MAPPFCDPLCFLSTLCWLPVFPDTLPPSPWSTVRYSDALAGADTLIHTHSPLAKASVPWPSRLRGNQFIGILGWGAGTKAALFKFM